MDPKKIGVVVALVAVIVIAVVLTAKRTSSTGAPAAVKAAQEALSAAKVDKIDKTTYEIFTETAADWQSKYAPDASGHYKNPKTGEYTMTSVIKCASCGALIPAPDMPVEPQTAKGMDRVRLMREEQEIRHNYKCPKCGRDAYAPETIAR
jgi:rRNA maturation protein Nop10